MEWFRIPSGQTLEELGSSRQGLSHQEAAVRLIKYGKNVIQERQKKAWWQVFLEQFQDLLVWILIAAAIVSVLTDNGESSLVIGAVLLLNAILGTVEHQKAEKSLESLRALSAPEAEVIREGRREKISAEEVVPGDILVLEAGDLAAADGRLLEAVELRVNESSLTGEAAEVEKGTIPLKGAEIPLAARNNMIFSGSLVTGGRGLAVVTAVGMGTEIGRIADLMNATEEKRTPLEVSLDVFSGKLAAGILAVCVMVFWLDIYRGEPLLDAVMFAVALAVAAIPEALGSIVTIVQAMGTQKMAREHAIIKELKAVESLGCVSVICTDKTGTLTQNRMEAEEVFFDFQTEEIGSEKGKADGRELLWRTALLANNSSGESGEPTEQALCRGGEAAGVRSSQLERRYLRKGEIPFDSRRKRMSVCCLDRETGREEIYGKGALEALLPCCDRIFDRGRIRELTEEDRNRLKAVNQRWSSEGMRVLAFACQIPDGSGAERAERPSFIKDWEQGLIFVGLAALTDPLRPETKAAVAAAREAGIRPVMITGDHPVTASSIARKAGILKPGGLTITGPELDRMGERELAEKLEQISVYARVSPEHKLRIVEAWQRKGRITAMTGDGINDAPALKKADIGIAMGRSGTEVSKDAAAMILADDNFATIIKAVSNGRNVYRNIKNAIGFLLSGNMAGIFCVLYASLAALPMPFLPVHLLFINLVTDSLPALAIGMEPPEEGLLKQPPRSGKEGILTVNFVKDLLVQGFLIAVCTMAAFRMGWASGAGPGMGLGPGGGLARDPEAVASTMAFTTLTLARLFHGFNCRSAHSILRLGFSSNLYSVMAFEAGVLLLAAVLFVPGLQTLFAAADLRLYEIAAVLICALIPTILIQAQKILREGRT
ncbi:MAG: cation-translocating P-type ATPase [Lachnospiraceae bacterium]|nr:cation-translocating P-type ATPase [Lachnospiraceae bacterium]